MFPVPYLLKVGLVVDTLHKARLVLLMLWVVVLGVDKI
jgi:hypothetical protein